MSLTDLDTYYIKSVSSLHSYDHVLNREPSILQVNLEEAIKSKTGVVKDFGPLIASISNRPLEEIRTTHGIEETKTASSSDNELELDLFNEDLMCVVCNGMDVGARNRLLECSDCHNLYHQECHRPPVTTFETDSAWTCQRCKDASKRMKKTTPGSSPLHAAGSSPTANAKPVLKSSPPHSQRGSSTSAPSSYKSSSSKSVSSVTISKSSSSSTKQSGKSSSSSSNSSSNSVKGSVTPNINIISADKRLQIMKKKAAKLHEKRKQLPR